MREGERSEKEEQERGERENKLWQSRSKDPNFLLEFDLIL